MSLIVAAFASWLAGGIICLIAGRRAAIARLVGPAGIVIGGALALVPVLQVLFKTGFAPPDLVMSWQMPLGSFHLGIDAISAFFALPILLICPLAAVYGGRYLRKYEGEKNTGLSWFFFSLLTASMVLVVLAKNAMLFLLSWEIMSLSSFFLVVFESEREDVRHAGWVYLVATHIGTAFILVLFALLGHAAGSMDFDDFKASKHISEVAGLVFVLALIGFGTKAGFMPLHVWLPEAHPAAPSHVSAVMSGVMLKTGIYGIVRVLTFFDVVPAWCGWTFIGVGCISGILGVLFALAQHDLKRLLAYHSVENIGIIALGLGIGLLGLSYGNHIMALAGFSGAILHVLNHAIFKSLLFMSAGAVLHATGTRDMDHLGGLLKRMPRTAAAFLVGAIAISGLPPLNGFISEFMIYFGAFKGVTTGGGMVAAGSLVVAGGLALIGGLAAACFTKAFGTVFMGEPRTSHAADARETGICMVLPMFFLAFLCAAIGLGAPYIAQPVFSVSEQIAGIRLSPLAQSKLDFSIVVISIVACAFAVFVALIALLRVILLSKKPIGSAVTWDCGYAAPTARMQYSSSSFAEPLTRFFHVFLRTKRKFAPPQGFFPSAASLSTETPDVSSEKVYTPIFEGIEEFLSRFRWIQHGRLNLYILYIVAALLALLAWKLR